MDTQNIINVDIDSRAVTLPVNFNLGVMYDNSCKTITFMVQKKSDITDLTDLTFSINTISAKRTPDKLECDCREEGDFYIVTALLKGTIFEASGKAVFNLCGQKFDSSHVLIKSWGSEDITALVGKHSHADKAIEELYPSILEELKQKVENPNLTDEQLDDIATKIAEKGFYTKSEVDSMIAGIVVPTRLSELLDDTEHRTVTDVEKEKWNKPSITVDTELSDTSENPVQNKAVSKGMDSLFSILTSHFNGQLNNLEEAVAEQLDTKANKADLPKKLSELADDTTHRLVTDEEKSKWNNLKNVTVDSELNPDSENPVTNKAITTGIMNFLENIISDFGNIALFKQWDKVGESSNIVNKPIIQSTKEYTNIIIIGKGLKANGDTQIQCGVSYLGNNYTIINGIDTTFDGDTSINYFAEIEVLPGVGVKATIRSGTKPLLECEQCYSTFIDADIGGIKYVSIETRANGVAFTSGKFTVYGR